MPVGALAGATVVAGVGSAAIGSKATKKAAKTAATASNQGTVAANALQREVYYNNVALASPFRDSGLRANAMLDQMLYGAPAASSPYLAPQAAPKATQGWVTPTQAAPQQYGAASPYLAAEPAPWMPSGAALRKIDNRGPGYSPELEAHGSGMQWEPPMEAAHQQPAPAAVQPYASSYMAPAQAVSASGFGPGPNYGATPNYGGSIAAPQYGGGLTSGMIGTALDPGSFTDYRQSTAYDWRLGQGVRARDMSASARGLRDSGAALKALTEYGQNIGSAERQNYLGEVGNYVRYSDAFDQNERNYGNTVQSALASFYQGERGYRDSRYDNFLGMLQGQQQMGLAGTSAVMGVGQNFANQSGQNIMAGANASANAALASGAANANLWANAGSSVGNALGTLGSSYIKKG